MQNIDPSTLNQLLNDSSPIKLFPDSFLTTVTTALLVLNILGLVFLVIYLFGTIRKWRVQSAILDMQKDMTEIKELLAAKNGKVSVAPKSPAVPTELTGNNTSR